MSVIITVATTGPHRHDADNPPLLTSPLRPPAEITAAVTEAYDAGAAVAHLHGRDD